GMKDLPEREAMKGMAARLKPYAEGKDLDLTREGPGRIQPLVTTTTGDADGQIVFYTFKGKSREHRLEFRRVQETADAASYLCTTEVSLALCIDIVDALGKWDEVKGLMDINDTMRGPRVTAWTPNNGKMTLSV